MQNKNKETKSIFGDYRDGYLNLKCTFRSGKQCGKISPATAIVYFCTRRCSFLKVHISRLLSIIKDIMKILILIQKIMPSIDVFISFLTSCHLNRSLTEISELCMYLGGGRCNT